MSTNQTSNFTAKSPRYWLCAVLALGILLVGLLAAVAPLTGSVMFGLPVNAVETIPWVRIAGMRDIALGLILTAMLILKERRTVGILILLAVVIPVSDGIIVFSATGLSYHIIIHSGGAIFMAVLGVVLVRGR
jgi:hypothetical protein